MELLILIAIVLVFWWIKTANKGKSLFREIEQELMSNYGWSSDDSFHVWKRFNKEIVNMNYEGKSGKEIAKYFAMQLNNNNQIKEPIKKVTKSTNTPRKGHETSNLKLFHSYENSRMEPSQAIALLAQHITEQIGNRSRLKVNDKDTLFMVLSCSLIRVLFETCKENKLEYLIDEEYQNEMTVKIARYINKSNYIVRETSDETLIRVFQIYLKEAFEVKSPNPVISSFKDLLDNVSKHLPQNGFDKELIQSLIIPYFHEFKNSTVIRLKKVFNA